QVSEIKKHDSYIAEIILQSVRKEAYGTSLQKPFRRFMENLLLGDARKRGENHLWMYDRFNLQSLLEEVGYRQVKIMTYNTSSIPNWESYGLDTRECGKPYIQNSLYVEALK
ncbi:MAG TPA: hypothetical protein PLP05_04520, partial [Sedimentisphaerales bacterium]|nr:hypothetical protein [Sedimentisphaerales bacterium]